MCGIFVCVVPRSASEQHRLKTVTNSVISHLRRRGPDCWSEKKCAVEACERGAYDVLFIGTVLHLRGLLTLQPICDDNGNVLLWNGEIFGGIEVEANKNDGMVLLETLVSQGAPCPTQQVLNTLSAVQGPWAFILWQAQEKKLWFGRDYFGRRSLLWHLPLSPADIFAVTSVASRPQAEEGMDWTEVPADGVYCLHVDTPVEGENGHTSMSNCLSDKLEHFSWTRACSLASGKGLCCPIQSPFNRTLPSEIDLESHQANAEEMVEPTSRLSANIDCHGSDHTNRFEGRVCYVAGSACNEPSATPTFCSVSTCGEERSANARRSCDTEQSEFKTLSDDTDSQTSSTEAPSLLEKFTSSTAGAAAQAVHDRKIESLNMGGCNTVNGGSSKADGSMAHRLISVLGKAVQKRVFNLPRNSSKGYFDAKSKGVSDNVDTRGDHSSIASECQKRGAVCHRDTDRPAAVGVLFSGGIDSMVLAALADRFVPAEEPIDLVNVAFGQKPAEERAQAAHKKKNRVSKRLDASRTSDHELKLNYEVPDRVTGKNGLEELSRLNGARQWRFVEVNVDLAELKSMRSRHISHLVSPLDTVLDDSIGCALWFAARGAGILRCPSCVSEDGGNRVTCSHQTEYTSAAKVLLVGMGADEQFGGYARHRTRFSQEGWAGLVDEIEMEVGRISTRNLGRDDRCISDHGREARFPFLDEHVVSFLNSLPVWIKTDPRLPRGVGEKRLLRHAAGLLGLTSSSTLPKRAIQFGSRIAKLESAGEKGSETCSRLT